MLMPLDSPILLLLAIVLCLNLGGKFGVCTRTVPEAQLD